MKKARSQLRIVDDIYALGLDGCILSISTDGVKGKLKISHEKNHYRFLAIKPKDNCT